jgi:hypothetical protein
MRGEFFNRTLRLNTTYFYSITNDIQIPARIDCNGLQISTAANPADLRNHRLEVDMEWLVTEAPSVTLSEGFRRAKYTDNTARVLQQMAVCRGNPLGLFQGAPACNAIFVDHIGNIPTPVRASDYTISLRSVPILRPTLQLGRAPEIQILS